MSPTSYNSSSNHSPDSLPYPGFPIHNPSSSSSADLSRISYITNSPSTPNADKLFYKPPIPTSQDSSPLTIDTSKRNGRGLSTSKEKEIDGVVVGYEMDKQELANMINPPSAGESSKQTKWKIFKNKSSNNTSSTPNLPSNHGQTIDIPETPPAVPPKTLSYATQTPKSTKTIDGISISSSSVEITELDSRNSHSTEYHHYNHQTLKKALHGRMTSASSHHLISKSSFDNLNAFSPTQSQSQSPYSPNHQNYQPYLNNNVNGNVPHTCSHTPQHSITYPNVSESFDHNYNNTNNTTQNDERNSLVASLAALPWATPPPREPSPIIPISQINQHQHRYSFLANDPTTSADGYGYISNSRRSSMNSIKSLKQEIKILSEQSDSLSGISGMANMGSHHTSSSISKRFCESELTETSKGVIKSNHDRYPSIESAMATKSQYTQNSKSQFTSSSASPSISKSNSKSTQRSKSTRSYNSKRGSTHTIRNGIIQRWEVYNSNHHWEILEGEELKKRENSLNLVQLVGRASMLEYVLKSGKRVSSQSIKQLRSFTPTSSSSSIYSPNIPRPPLPHLQSNSISSTSSKFQQPFVRPSISTRRSSSTRQSRKSSSSKSFRRKLGKKIKRNKSREDIFTEIDSDESFDVNDNYEKIMYSDRHDEVPQLVKEPSSNSQTLKIVNNDGKDRFGNDDTGIIVFPEEISNNNNDSQNQLKLNKNKNGKFNSLPQQDNNGGGRCIPSNWNLSPSKQDQYEKSRNHTQDQMKAQNQDNDRDHNDDRGDEEEVSRYYPQSPHLGHRSPNWRNRQSVLSYIETGQWENDKQKRNLMFKIVLIGGLIVILIIGLLVGLLTRRKS
ncbi:uncharacterized protein L201_001465 [Kwoniella dendrophila CBS 6074]|uniref:Uncharacterized protein n=1 Tax=Kwoniella dendrophila CBS 6074 TaxID=1295534 RepID=A0AAX4JNY8_9TREE